MLRVINLCHHDASLFLISYKGFHFRTEEALVLFGCEGNIFSARYEIRYYRVTPTCRCCTGPWIRKALESQSSSRKQTKQRNLILVLEADNQILAWNTEDDIQLGGK
jgi:hypothetical protein